MTASINGLPTEQRDHAVWEGPRGEGWVLLQALLLLAYLRAPRIGPAWSAPWLMRSFGLLIMLAGGVLAGTGMLALGPQLTPLPYPTSRGRLVERGPYRLVRHPIYGGLGLGVTGLAFATAHPLRLVLALLLVAFFDAKASREERWLIARYPDYPTYRQRVRKLIPWLY